MDRVDRPAGMVGGGDTLRCRREPVKTGA